MPVADRTSGKVLILSFGTTIHYPASVVVATQSIWKNEDLEHFHDVVSAGN
jgi:hypothetical protein